MKLHFFWLEIVNVSEAPSDFFAEKKTREMTSEFNGENNAILKFCDSNDLVRANQVNENEPIGVCSHFQLYSQFYLMQTHSTPVSAKLATVCFWQFPACFRCKAQYHMKRFASSIHSKRQNIFEAFAITSFPIASVCETRF